LDAWILQAFINIKNKITTAEFEGEIAQRIASRFPPILDSDCLEKAAFSCRQTEYRFLFSVSGFVVSAYVTFQIVGPLIAM